MSKSKQRADTVGRMEVIAKAVRRRRWPEDVRAAIIAEALEEGAVVSAIARRHGVAPSQVFAWRKAAREQALALGSPTALFAPVVFEDRKAPSPSACAEPRSDFGRHGRSRCFHEASMIFGAVPLRIYIATQPIDKGPDK